jgi:hypothetical protein
MSASALDGGATVAAIVAGRRFTELTREQVERVMELCAQWAGQTGFDLEAIPDEGSSWQFVDDSVHSLVVGRVVAVAEADEEEQGKAGWHYSAEVEVPHTRLVDELNRVLRAPAGFWESAALLGGHLDGEASVWLSSYGPLCAGWLRSPNGHEDQVSFDGTPSLAIAIQPGTYVLAAQFD